MVSSEDEATRAVRVHGRVQGVGFRWWTRRQALRLGLVGDVRNLPTGGVEVHACGTPEALSELADALLAGPPTSSVTSVESIEPNPSMPRDDFHIEVR